MAESIIAPQGVPEQEAFSFILNGESLTQRTKFSFEDAKKDPKDILSKYQWLIKQAHRYHRKIKNPINKRTGEPLKASTLKGYQSQANSYKRSAKERKQAIKLLILYGYLGQNKTRARWVREFRLYKASRTTVDYLKGLDGLEKRFVEVYDGKATLAARQAGCSGNYIFAKLTGREIIKKPEIQDALKLKTIHKMKLAGITVVHGGGQGDGKPFKCPPDNGCEKKVVRLTSYWKDIYKRTRARIDRFEAVYDNNLDNLKNADGTPNVRNNNAFNCYAKLSIMALELDYYKPDKDKFNKVKEKLVEAEKKFGIQLGNYKGY